MKSITKKHHSNTENEKNNDFYIEVFLKLYGTCDKCMKTLEKAKWGKHPYSPYSLSTNVERVPQGNPIAKRLCKGCKKNWYWRDRNLNRYFTVKKGTPFESSQIPINKWFLMIWIICASRNEVSSSMYSKLIGVTQKTAWFMHQRIMNCLEQCEIFSFKGTVEIDECFYGGKDKWRPPYKKTMMLDDGIKGKQPVFGAIERDGGRLYMKKVEGVGSNDLLPLIIPHLTESTTVFSDEHQPYKAIGKICNYDYVCHSANIFLKRQNNAHIQTIENTWTMCKSGMAGSYRSVSRFHLQKYIDEFVFWHNTANLEPKELFLCFLKLMNRHISYDKLKQPGRETYSKGKFVGQRKRGRMRELKYKNKKL